MQISWHGFSCFDIQVNQIGQKASLVIDPYQNSTGLRLPRTLEAQALASTHEGPEANNFSVIAGNPFIMNQAGEYEVGGMFFYVIDAPCQGKTDHRIIRLEAEDMHLAHLGSLNRPLFDEELKELQNIDILMIPVGGGRVLSPKMAVEVIGQIEPRVVIPMFYALPNISETLSSLDVFFKEFGSSPKEEVTKYKISRKDLPEEEMTMVVLARG